MIISRLPNANVVLSTVSCRAVEAEEEVEEFDHVEKLQQLGINSGTETICLFEQGLENVLHICTHGLAC